MERCQSEQSTWRGATIKANYRLARPTCCAASIERMMVWKALQDVICGCCTLCMQTEFVGGGWLLLHFRIGQPWADVVAMRRVVSEGMHTERAGVVLSQATEVRRPVQVQSGFTAWSAQEASRVPESRVLQAVLDRVSFPIPPLPVSNRDPNPPAVIDLTSSPAASPVRSVQDSDDDVFFLGTLEGRSAQNRARRPAAAPPAAEPSQRTRAHSPVPSQRDARSPGAVRGAEPVTSAFAATRHEHGLSPSQRWPSPAELSAERDRLPMLRTTQGPRQQSSTEGRLATGELGREHTRGRADGAQQAGMRGGAHSEHFQAVINMACVMYLFLFLLQCYPELSLPLVWSTLYCRELTIFCRELTMCDEL